MGVSIPSNGSIQFLQVLNLLGIIWFPFSLNPLKRVNSILTGMFTRIFTAKAINSLNPLKRVNSILTEELSLDSEVAFASSQSPQTGQFNSYYIRGERLCVIVLCVSIPSNGSIQFLR